MLLYLEGEEAQEAFGRRIAAHLRPPSVVFLEGDLGVGKTTLVRGILRGLGHHGSVRSPTYTLIEPYEVRGFRIYHLDLYRLGDPEELEYLGLRDFLDQGSVLLVEWPERGDGSLPPPDLIIRMAHSAPGRRLELIPGGGEGDRLVAELLLSSVGVSEE
jgi:tRNA threonylcarbamoyladenosine biosynthesis protein TsaE